MSRIRPGKFKACRHCGEPREQVGYLSARGLCSECGIKAASESARQMEAKEGPYYEEWLRSMRHASRKLADRYGG